MSLRSHLHLRHSSSGRDAALDRLRVINRSILAGSVALTAIFADTAANTFAGGTSQAKRASARHASASKKSKAADPARPSPLLPPAESPSGSSEHEPEPEATPTQEPAPSSEAAPQTEETAPEVQATEEPRVEAEPEQAPEEAAEPPVVSGGS